MVIPNLIYLNTTDEGDCEVHYLVENRHNCLVCSLSDYERAADPQLFLDRSLDQVYSEISV